MQIFFNFLLKQFLQIHTAVLFSVNICQINYILLKKQPEYQAPNRDIRLNKQAQLNYFILGKSEPLKKMSSEEQHIQKASFLHNNKTAEMRLKF